jgi:hypothetical protein
MVTVAIATDRLLAGYLTVLLTNGGIDHKKALSDF